MPATQPPNPHPGPRHASAAEHGEVRDPIHAVSYSFERDGANLWVFTWLEDGGHLPEHFHPTLEER